MRIYSCDIGLTVVSFFTIFFHHNQGVYMDQQPTTAAPVELSSFMTRMTNVFASPTELFSELTVTKAQTSSWLMPYIILALLAIVSTYVVYNNSTLRQQIYDMQEQGYKKAVAEQKMTQEQADQISEKVESSGPGMFMAFGAGFQIITISAMMFLGALVYWAAAKIVLKFSGDYSKILELFGLASVVGILGTIVTLIMMNLMNSMVATPSAGVFLLGSFDPMNKAHKLLAQINIFTLWQTGFIGWGMAKISGKSTGTGLGISYGLWAVWTLAISLLF